MNIFLETKRLYLKRMEWEDFAAICILRADPLVMRFIGYGNGPGKVQSTKEVRQFFNLALPYQEKHGLGFSTVIEKTTGTIIGQAGLFHVGFDDNQPEIELAYRLRPESWGKGYATELSEALLAWGFRQLPAERIVAFVHSENAASRRVLEKVGMLPTGTVQFGDAVRFCHEVWRETHIPLSFSTKRMLARRILETDHALYWQLNQDPEVVHTLGKRTEAESLASLSWNVEHWAHEGFGLWMFFRKQDFKPAGRSGLRRIVVDGREEVELGYSLLPEFWGKGIATEMAEAIRDIALEKIGLKGIISVTTTENVGSIRVMEKLGMFYEKTVVYLGKTCVVYRLT